MSLELTESEERIAQLIGQRWSIQDIADELDLRYGTVLGKLSMIYMKLHIPNKAALAVLYGAEPITDSLTDFYWDIIHAICAKRMSLNEAADFLGYHRTTIWRHLQRIYTIIGDIDSMNDLREWYDNR